MVARRCVPLGGRWRCENRGVQVSDYSMCMSRRWHGGGVALCVVEGVGLLAAASNPTLYRSSTRGPEDDSVESKHVAPL